MTMLSSELANILLYVPFNREYLVPARVSDCLDMNEFFSQCYYAPDFDKVIESIENMQNEEDKYNTGDIETRRRENKRIKDTLNHMITEIVKHQKNTEAELCKKTLFEKLKHLV